MDRSVQQRRSARPVVDFVVGAAAVVVPVAVMVSLLVVAGVHNPGAVAFLVVLFVISVAVWLAPIFVARWRGVSNQGPIIVITILLGWSLLGWAAAMSMAVRDRPVGVRGRGYGA